jgi:hypothetical protein
VRGTHDPHAGGAALTTPTLSGRAGADNVRGGAGRGLVEELVGQVVVERDAAGRAPEEARPAAGAGVRI